MALSMADGTITTGDEIAQFIKIAGDGALVQAPAEQPSETCDLPTAPLAMPAQPIEPGDGPLRRLWQKLRPSGRGSTSVDVGA